MKKRVLSLFLAVVLMISLVPAVQAEETESIEAQIRAYAESIDQNNAESSAAMALATHGITGGGKTLKLGEGSALAALLLNSEQFQYWMIEGCGRTIRAMQSLDWTTTRNFRGFCTWYDEKKEVCLRVFQNELDESFDWQPLFEDYTGSWNDYDRALVWMVGTAHEFLQITRTEVKDDTAVYRVECTIKDTFDFDTAGNSNFKKFLSGIGMLMFKEFKWECHISFDLEVPYTCSHSTGAYHWTYDAESNTMTADTGDGFSRNEASYTPYQSVYGNTLRIFSLEEPVRLLHDRPWVMEYDVVNPTHIAFAPIYTNYVCSIPLLLHTTGESLLMKTKEHLLDNEGIHTEYHNHGTRLRPLFSYNSSQVHTFRLENVVSDDGSNCVYLTVTNAETGVVCLDKVPLNDEYLAENQGAMGELVDEESDWISGRDFYINFIGNMSYSFGADYFDLRVWENGKGNEVHSFLSTEVVGATCTRDGGVLNTCSLCGAEFMTGVVPAYGHNFSEWKTVKEASCTAEGRMERSCRSCGELESRAIGMIPHSYSPTVTEATCTEPGFTTYVCGCGERYVADNTEALGHNLTPWAIVVEPGCTEAGSQERNCLRCDYQEVRSADPTGHQYTSVIQEPGCTAGGYTEYTCANCGDSYRTAFTNPMGHRYEGVVTAPGCTAGGYTTYTCICGDSYRSDFTAPTGHRHEATVTEPGCTTGGYTTYTCACGDSYRSDFTSPTGHRHEAAVTEPGCTEGGFTTYTCDCGNSYVSDFVDALGHDFAGGVCTRCGDVDPDYQPIENPFNDVPAGAFYEAPVLWALENGITTGATADSFNPNGSCLRAHVVTFLWRAAGQPEPANCTLSFSDVKSGDFFCKPVLWAVENSITNGVSAGQFGSYSNCNRAAVVTFLWRAAGSPEPNSAENPFADVNPTDFFYKAVLWAVENGVTNGVDATHFGPTTECNRAQVVTFLYRAYN